MEKRKYKNYMIIGFLFVSVLGTLAHFFYEWSGSNMVVGLFTPINESVWEHLKLLWFPTLLFTLLCHIKLQDGYPLLFSAITAGSIAGCILIPIIYYTYTFFTGRNIAVIDIGSFFVANAVSFVLAYKICRTRWGIKLFVPAIIAALAISLIFFQFTFYPPALELFAEP